MTTSDEMHRMLPSLVALVATSGCHTVFDLDHVPPAGTPGDGGPDAPVLDEDDDKLTDDSDNCPGVANADQLESDGDGIGDACDPHPATIDRILISDLFNGTTHELTADPSTWSLADGRLTTRGGADGTAATLSSVANQVAALEIGFVVDEYGMTDDNQVRIRIASSGADGDCELHGSPLNAGTVSFNGVTGLLTLPADLAPRTRHTMRFQIDTGDSPCRVDDTTFPGTGGVTTGTAVITLSITGMTFSLTHAVVYSNAQ